LLLLLLLAHLPLMSAGPIAESYRPSGMMLLKLSYVMGDVMRFTLSFFTCSRIDVTDVGSQQQVFNKGTERTDDKPGLWNK
jgi:hypothetical protein